MDNCPHRYCDEKFKKRTFTNTKGKREPFSVLTVRTGCVGLVSDFGAEEFLVHCGPSGNFTKRVNLEHLDLIRRALDCKLGKQ